MYNINRRKFLGLFGCGCCSVLLPSCSTVPITERKQLSIIPEAQAISLILLGGASLLIAKRKMS